MKRTFDTPNCSNFRIAKDSSANAGRLSAEDEQRLAEVLDNYVTRYEQGEQIDSAALIAEHPQFASELKQYLEGIKFLQRAANELDGVLVPSDKDSACENRRLGDYQLVQEIGRGGMGIVYEAHQLSLGRQVAIKILPFASVLDPKQIARFTREAQAAAQLHHPHIVPIYAVGCERGVHYYSMQLIDGQTLEQALRQLRGESNTVDEATITYIRDRKPAASTWEEDQLPEPNNSAAASTARSSPTDTSRSRASTFATDGSLSGKAYHRRSVEIMIRAAEALQHAHEYGVIHRDIKPSNLLIDSRGKPWVTDFGVARLQNDASVTATGDVLGTLRYMSPEQATGSSVLVDHRSDIYSLGVTLYEMLTLRHPHAGVQQREMVRHIELIEPPRPRTIDASIPVDLEKIVIKATAKSREQRYQTANEFAQDMQRFLDGKPVLAKPPALVERAAKWAGRHRTLVATCLLLMTVTLIATTTASILVMGEQVKTRRSQRQAAERFEKAREVVDRLGTSFALRLADVPGAEVAQSELLYETLKYYEEFAREASDDPTLQTELAKTYFGVGRIHQQIAGDEPALAAFQTAKLRFAQLVQTAPDNPAHWRGLGLTCNNIGLILSRHSHVDDAHRALGEAAQAHRRAIDAWPLDVTHQADLAVVLCNLGHHASTIDVPQSEVYYNQAIKLFHEILSKTPRDDNVRSHLALVYNNLSRLQAGRDNVASERNTRESLRIQAELVERSPNDISFQSDLALSLNNLGAFTKNNGAPDEARQAYERSIEIRTKLMRLRPSVLQHQRDLAISYNNLGMLEHGEGNLFAGRQALEESRRLHDMMIQREPNEPSLRASLAGVFHNLGICLEQLGELENATLAFSESVRQQEMAVVATPDNHAYQQMLTQYHSVQERLQHRLTPTPDANRQSERAASQERKPISQEPIISHESQHDKI